MLADILLNRLPPPPKLGVGRIHRLEDEIPCEAKRYEEILSIIRSGGNGYHIIEGRLTFHPPRAMLVADCEELAERGAISIIKEKGHSVRLVPA